MFPENVALPIGGPSSKHYAVIEMHYDNPNFREGKGILTLHINHLYVYNIINCRYN